MTLARTFVVLVALALAPAGCSFAQLHGYEVAHTSMDVEYRPGPIGLRTTGVRAEVPPEFDGALRSSLAEATNDYHIVTDAEDPSHTVHVRLMEVGSVPSGTRFLGEVDFSDRNGAVSSQLRIDLTVPETGAPAASLAGDAFGARVGDYLTNRERYHW